MTISPVARDHPAKRGAQRAHKRAGAAAAEKADAHGDQAQADGRHDHAGDDRREEPAQGLNEEALHHLPHAADQGRAHHRAVGINAGLHIGGDGPGGNARHHADGNGLVDADEAGGGAHDDGQPRADGADGIELKERDKAGNEHGVLQQRDTQRLIACVHRDAADGHQDQQRGQVANEHGQHVLQAQRDRLPQRQPSVEIVRGCESGGDVGCFHRTGSS